VHGVSGTPAEHMLECPPQYLKRVGGDKAAGFYECRDAGTNPVHGVRREAYSWGGLTSGPATRGLWLLFLPFILINLAHWMLPPSNAGKRAANAAITVLRLLALSLTLTLMLASVQILVDLVGWQCAAISRCGEQLGPLNFLTQATEGQRIALTAVPVVILLGVLLLLGRANPAIAKRAEVPSCTPKETPAAAVVTTGELPLQDPNFWNPDDSVRRMRGCHVIAWMSGLAALVAAVSGRYLDGSSVLDRLCWGLAFANAVLVGLAVVFTLSTKVTGRGGVGTKYVPMKLITGLVAGSVVLCLATLVTVGLTDSDRPYTGPTHLPILRDAIYSLLVIQGVLVAAAFATTVWCVRGNRCGDGGWSPSLRGFVAPVVATIALLAAGGLSAGLGLWSAQFLGTPVPSTREAQCLEAFRSIALGSTAVGDPTALCDSDKQQQLRAVVTLEDRLAIYPTDTPLILPPGYFVAALVFLGLLALLAVVTAYLWLRVRRRRTRQWLPKLAEEYGRPIGDPRIRAIAQSRAVASLTDDVPRILAWLTGVALFALVCIGVTFATLEAVFGFDRMPVSYPVVSNVSIAAITLTAAGMVALAVGAFRNREQRRLIGILWDVITFWPRANHPLTPPCYAERTVPDLRDELVHLRGGGPVVLSAHSQGTIIAAATLLHLGDEAKHVALLTFGCPLRRLYGRNFPAYFNRKAMDVVAAQRHGRWLNLWAYTDPIGGWVCQDKVVVQRPVDGDKPLLDLTAIDNRLLDAESVEVQERGGYPPICGHSGFWTRDEYDAAIAALVAQPSAVEPSAPLDDVRVGHAGDLG
jgi:hypothetical protein